MMKKLFPTILALLFAVPCIAANDDISDRPELGTATNSDSMLGVAASASAGARLRRILFQGTNGFVLTGNGTWFDLTTALAAKADKENIAFNAATYGDITISGTVQNAGAFESGVVYVIASVGTTDFTLIGASANTIGVEFTASGAGSGTGTATPLRPIISDTTPTADKQKIAPTYEQMDEALALKQNVAGATYPSATSTTTVTGNINIDGVSADHYYFNNGASTATYTPVITAPPASGYERGIVLTVGGGAGVITMTWTNVTWLGTAGAATTTTNKYSSYGCLIRSAGNALCKIVAEAHD